MAPASSPPPLGARSAGWLQAVSAPGARRARADDAGPTPPWPVVAARDLARLVVPVSCPGCGARDLRWCAECESVWWQEVLRSESSAPRLHVSGLATLPVWAIAPLEGSAHSMVAAWKDAGRRDLDALFTAAMTRAAAAIAPALRDAGAGRAWSVVPVPARRASTARRGANLPLMLANAAALGLRDGGVEAGVVDILTGTGRELRQASARSRVRAAAFTAKANAHSRAQARGGAPLVLLVDDVLTTGASLAAATRAIDVGFLTVGAGLCLAATPRSGAHASA